MDIFVKLVLKMKKWRMKNEEVGCKYLIQIRYKKATFIDQDIVVFPEYTRVPDNLNDAVKFLFGESAEVEWGRTNSNRTLVRIKRANYILDNVTTLQADFLIKEYGDALLARCT